MSYGSTNLFVNPGQLVPSGLVYLYALATGKPAFSLAKTPTAMPEMFQSMLEARFPSPLSERWPEVQGIYYAPVGLRAGARVPAAVVVHHLGGSFEIEALIAGASPDEAKALRYAFFAEREVAKIPDAPKDLKPARIRTAAVVGAGTMGGGIAMSFADFGIPVKVLEVSREALDKGLQRVRDNYAISVKRGSLSQAEMDRRLPLIQPVDSYEAIAD